jgi:methionyl-tRNA formyltransferase
MPQPDAGVTYATKLDKTEAAIDWTASALAIDRKVRALDPAPGALTVLDGEVVKIWRAEPEPSAIAGVSADAPSRAQRTYPGTIVDAGPRGLVVACGEGMLRITELQPAGSRRMDAAAFSAGRRNLAGARFGAPVP